MSPPARGPARLAVPADATPDEVAAWPVEGPLDLYRTLARLRGSSEGSRLLSPDGCWWTDRTDDGPTTVHLSLSGHTLEAQAFGPGAALILAGDRVPRLVGLHDDRSTFEPSRHPKVDRLDRSHPGVRMGATGDPVAALLPAVLGQRVTTREAKGSLAGLYRMIGEPAPGPVAGLRLPLDPDRVAGLSTAELHTLGVERNRAGTLLAVCRRAGSIRRVGRGLAGTSGGVQLGERLGSLPGLGPWTLAQVRRIAVGDPDAVLLGDLHLPNTVAWLLAGEARADDARMVELLEPFVGHRARVQLLCKSGGQSAPRRGPRYRPLPIAEL